MFKGDVLGIDIKESIRGIDTKVSILKCRYLPTQPIPVPGIDTLHGIDTSVNVTPDPEKPPKFDPHFGFDYMRKERAIKATAEELQSAKVHPKDRDYCSDFLLKFRACRKDNFPWVVKCEHEKHAYLHCQHEDFVLRMKEFERERRLLERQKRKEAMAA
ncbi:nadh:ubiquinone oxidoreductase b18-like subunit [Holotrichia oblita]|uniref:Nadh:ubiquinone oxidoreductase b18-like subunit n=1 Tax=Holotrichia oblita TaxID=644536 RepID=A0ACB9T3K9_HOLOL|nr:nadh:ubiquinone oxidoreductase b18-like subunit [Holotrichia oblita]